MNEQLQSVVRSLLHDNLVTAQEQMAIRQALGSQVSHDLLLWVTCRNRRKMTGRQFVVELCKRL